MTGNRYSKQKRKTKNLFYPSLQKVAGSKFQLGERLKNSVNPAVNLIPFFNLEQVEGSEIRRMEFVFRMCSPDTSDSKVSFPVAARLRETFTCAFRLLLRCKMVLKNLTCYPPPLPPAPLEKRGVKNIQAVLGINLPDNNNKVKKKEV